MPPNAIAQVQDYLYIQKKEVNDHTHFVSDVCVTFKHVYTTLLSILFVVIESKMPILVQFSVAERSKLCVVFVGAGFKFVSW